MKLEATFIDKLILKYISEYIVDVIQLIKNNKNPKKNVKATFIL